MDKNIGLLRFLKDHFSNIGFYRKYRAGRHLELPHDN